MKYLALLMAILCLALAPCVMILGDYPPYDHDVDGYDLSIYANAYDYDCPLDTVKKFAENFGASTEMSQNKVEAYNLTLCEGE